MESEPESRHECSNGPYRGGPNFPLYEDDVILDNIVDTGSVYSYNVCEIPESICDRQTGSTAGTMIEDINSCEVAG